MIPEEEELLNEDLDTAVVVSDNIDETENTDTGFGTSHRVNSILVTKKSTNHVQGRAILAAPTKKKCRRSLPSDKVVSDIPDYVHGKRVGPGNLQCIKDINKSTKYEELSTEQRMNFLIWIGMRGLKTSPTLLVPGWTGFNIVIRKDLVVIENKITYLDTLDAPATEIKTAYEVLCRGLEIKDRLGLKSVLCVFDQAFYAKVAEIIWKHKEKFQDIVIMLGGFHLLMMFLGVMGTRFGDAGFRDLIVQSEVIAEGSVQKVIECKHYNCAVHAHKITYEALCRLIYSRFMDWMNQENESTVTDVNRLLDEAKHNLQITGITHFREKPVIKNLDKYFYQYRQRLKTEGTNLQKFWMSYLEMSELLLNLIYSTRVGDWELYLACIEQVIPWAFAYDRQIYARFLLPYLNDMRRLPKEKPEVYQALCEGEFSVQMKNTNGFSCNEADKTIENTINRDCKTSGGFNGFSTKFSTTQKWVLNASRRGHYRRLLNEHISANPKKHTHRELLPSAIKKDVAAVEKVIAVVEEIFSNPWKGDDLISLSSGLYAPSELVEDLLNARTKGLEDCMDFIKLRCSEKPSMGYFDNFKKRMLQTLSSLKKTVSVKSKDRTLPLKMDKDLFARITIVPTS